MVTTTKRQYEWNRKFQFLSWEADKESKRNTKSKSIFMVIELQMIDVESGIIVMFFLFFLFYPFLTLHLKFFVNLSVCRRMSQVFSEA